jgi:hypothetical protein
MNNQSNGKNVFIHHSFICCLAVNICLLLLLLLSPVSAGIDIRHYGTVGNRWACTMSGNSINQRMHLHSVWLLHSVVFIDGVDD